MGFFDIMVHSLRFFIPSVFSLMFRAAGLGYRSKKKVALGLSAFTIYSLVVPPILINLIGYGEYTHITSIVMMIGGMSVLIFSTDTPGKTIFLHLIQANMVATLSAPLNMLRHLMGFSYGLLLLLFLVCSPLLFLVALRFWAKPLRFMADNIHDGMAALLALPIITQMLVVVLPTYPARNFEFHPVYCTLMMLVVETLFFLYIYSLYCNLRKISLLARQQLQQEVLQAEIDAQEQFLQAARQSRHDLHHHNALLLEYLKDGEVERAKEYLQRQEADLKEAEMTLYCKHPAANAVLRHFERRARAQHTTYAVHADVPQDLPLTDTEVGILLSNLLENACEACAKKELTAPAISLSIKCERRCLKLELRNSVAGETEFDPQGMPVSRKSGGGTGTRSVETVVKRHGGMLRFFRENDSFVTQITLPTS